DARGTLTVWEVSSGREAIGFRAFDTPKPEPGEDFPIALAFDREGRRLAVGALKAIEVRDVVTGKTLATLHAGLAAAFVLAFSPDGRQLAAALLKDGGAASTNEIKLWDLATGSELVTFTGAVGGTYALAFTPDGQRLATTGYYHRDVMLW